MKLRKVLGGVLSLLLVVGMIPAASAAEDAPEDSATSTVVMDAYTGQIIYEKNADEQRPIASITKIMTAYLAVEDMTLDDERLDETYTVSEHAANSDEGGTSLYLEAGDTVTFEVLLYGTMLRSGNDAAVALAEACADGDEDAFIEMMNAKAEELGMTNTHFSSTNGLVDEDNYSTARDMAVLAQVAMQNELFAKIVSTWYIEIGGYEIENHNNLLQLMDGCIGVKTGWTTLAGRTLVSCAERDGSKFIIVTLNDANDYEDHENLYDWAFENYPANVLCEEGEEVATFHIGNQDVPLLAASTLTASVASSSENPIQCSISLPSKVSGAVSKGEVAGTATYTVNGEVIGTVDLLYGAIVVN
ncbi:MAG: D-alanyl-D-alanine carboxypeptidase [Clostridiales bacterium]|nr:D-alanyl-D-alanine carboxypeptidase [Clostridiales bacterium]